MAAMRRALILCLVALCAAPAAAQEPEGPPRAEDIEEGLDLLGEGARRVADHGAVDRLCHSLRRGEVRIAQGDPDRGERGRFP